MKPITLLLLLGLLACNGCSTAEHVTEKTARGTAHVAQKLGHVAAHGVQKTGHALAHGGEEIASATER